MTDTEKAAALFQEGFSCSQAVLATFAGRLGLDRSMALKLSDGFGGGMRMALTCGAVTGAFMAIGLKHGRSTATDGEAKQRTGELVQEFASRFAHRNGSISCRELLGCDISTTEGLEQARKQGLTATRCPRLVTDAAQILGQLL